MPNPYRIRSTSAPQRRRNPYIADTERQRQMQEQGTSQLASPSWMPEQTTTQPDVSTNPYAPAWKRQGRPNPYAVRPSLPPTGSPNAPLAQPQQPLTSEQQIQVETQHGPYLGALSAVEKEGDAEGLTRLLSQVPPGAERHPLVQRLKTQQGAGALPPTLAQKAAQRTREVLEAKKMVEGEAAAEKFKLLGSDNSVVNALTNPPQDATPLEVRTSEIFMSKGVVEGLLEKRKTAVDAIQKNEAPPADVFRAIEQIDKALTDLGLQAEKEAQSRLDYEQARQDAAVDNMAKTWAKLTPEQQQQRRQELAATNPELLQAFESRYPEGVSSAKPLAKPETFTALGTLAQSYIDELPAPEDFTAIDKKIAGKEEGAAEEKQALQEMVSPEALNEQRERFVIDNIEMAQTQGLDEDNLRTIWEQKLRARKLKRIQIPVRPDDIAKFKNISSKQMIDDFWKTGKTSPELDQALDERRITAGEVLDGKPPDVPGRYEDKSSSSIDSRINRLRAAGASEEEIQGATA